MARLLLRSRTRWASLSSSPVASDAERYEAQCKHHPGRRLKARQTAEQAASFANKASCEIQVKGAAAQRGAIADRKRPKVLDKEWFAVLSVQRVHQFWGWSRSIRRWRSASTSTWWACSTASSWRCLGWGAAVAHVSTCFVVGKAGQVFEDEPIRLLPQEGRARGQGLRRRHRDRRLPRSSTRPASAPTTTASQPSSATAPSPASRAKAATPTTRRPCAWPWAASASSGCREADRGRHGARPALGLAQHVHVHEVARRAGVAKAETRGLRVHGAAVDRRERAALPVPGLERGLHDVGAADVHGHQGPSRSGPTTPR